MFYIAAFGQDILLSSSPVNSSNINPFRNIKTSLFFRYGSSNRLGFNKVAGVEIRRFVSLQKHIYAEFSYADWTNRMREVATKNYDYGSYTLTSNSISSRVGLAIFGSQNLYVGGHYLLKINLSERVPPH